MRFQARPLEPFRWRMGAKRERASAEISGWDGVGSQLPVSKVATRRPTDSRVDSPRRVGGEPGLSSEAPGSGIGLVWVRQECRFYDSYNISPRSLGHPSGTPDS